MAVPFVDGVTPLDATHMNGLQQTVDKGAPNGYAGLDATGIVPAAQLPAAASSVPTGAFFDWPAAAPPTGYLLCDGSAVSRTGYAALFAVLGTTYGAGDGSTTFNLPDFQGRIAVYKGSNADVNALGKNEGQANANRSPKHQHSTSSLSGTLPNHGHSLSDPGHAHSVAGNMAVLNDNGAGGNGFAGGSSVPWGITINSSQTGISVGNPTSLPTIPISGSIGSGTPGEAPAYLVVNKIIKT